MYKFYYGFNESPFSLLPDPQFLYLGRKHSIAFAILEYSLMSHAGFTVITGEIGSGKTTLMRHLLNNIPEEISVGLITNTHKSFGSLLRWILEAFNIDYSEMDQPGLLRVWQNYLIDEYAHGRRTLLIIDEAQNLGADTLEELRVLSNINADHDQMLQLLLVGQPELRDILQLSEMRQLAQRVVLDFHLTALDAEEVFEYIHHRLHVARGAESSLFTEDAIARVAYHSRGVPRLVNLLCDAALLYGYVNGEERIEAKVVEEVTKEKLRGGVVPLQKSSLFAV